MEGEDGSSSSSSSSSGSSNSDESNEDRPQHQPKPRISSEEASVVAFLQTSVGPITDDRLKQSGLTDALRGDATFAHRAVRLNGHVLQHLTRELRADETIVLEAIPQAADAFLHANYGLRGRRVFWSKLRGATA